MEFTCTEAPAPDSAKLADTVRLWAITVGVMKNGTAEVTAG